MSHRLSQTQGLQSGGDTEGCDAVNSQLQPREGCALDDHLLHSLGGISGKLNTNSVDFTC
jgi:hypothetical protein